MPLACCTLTGLDDTTNFNDVKLLTEKYSDLLPFQIEWGFLYSPKRKGSDRYPSLETLYKTFDELLNEDIQISLHICGDGVHDLLDGDITVNTLVDDIKRLDGKGRVQLNFNQQKNPIDIDKLILYFENADSTPSDISFITQYNQYNKDVYKSLLSLEHQSLLFDSSLGTGLPPESWLAPIDGIYCGYAGGLNPNNIKEQYKAIEQASNGYYYWIDMESGVRTNDKFDLVKCEQIFNSIMES